jgi:hypothetical protein
MMARSRKPKQWPIVLCLNAEDGRALAKQLVKERGRDILVTVQMDVCSLVTCYTRRFPLALNDDEWIAVGEWLDARPGHRYADLRRLVAERRGRGRAA